MRVRWLYTKRNGRAFECVECSLSDAIYGINCMHDKYERLQIVDIRLAFDGMILLTSLRSCKISTIVWGLKRIDKFGLYAVKIEKTTK